MLCLTVLGGKGVINAGGLPVEHGAVEGKGPPVKGLLLLREKLRRSAEPCRVTQLEVGIGQSIQLRGWPRLCRAACKEQEQGRRRKQFTRSSSHLKTSQPLFYHKYTICPVGIKRSFSVLTDIYIYYSHIADL